MHLSEGEHDLPRALVERVLVEELSEMLAGLGVLAGGDRVEADLELGVDDPGLGRGPLGAVRVAVDVGLPLLDGLVIFLLVEEQLRDLEEGLALEILEVLGRGDARLGIGRRCFLVGDEFEVLAVDEVAVSGDGLVGATEPDERVGQVAGEFDGQLVSRVGGEELSGLGDVVGEVLGVGEDALVGDVGFVTLDGATAAVVELHDDVLKDREKSVDVLAGGVVFAVDDLRVDQGEPRLEAVLAGCDGILFELAALTRRAADRTRPGRVEVVEVLAQDGDRLRMLFEALEGQGDFELDVVARARA